MYASYAKDVFLSLLENLKIDMKYEIQELQIKMAQAILLVKQARDSFRE